VTWTPSRIRAEWLGSSTVAHGDKVLVAAFDTVEATFGADWLEALRGPAAGIGSLPTLSVVISAQLIGAVGDLPGAAALLKRYEAGEPGVKSELLAVAAYRRLDAATEVSLAPPVRVGDQERVPDLAVTRGAETVYIEVSAAQRSQEYLAAQALVDRLSEAALRATPIGSCSEVYLHRSPEDDESR